MQTFMRWTDCYGPREKNMEGISSFLHAMESSDPHLVEHLLTVVASMAADLFSFYFFK